MFVLRIVSPNDSKPKKSNTHKSKKRFESVKITNFRRFKVKAIGFLVFKDSFNRAKTKAIIFKSFSSITISKDKKWIRRSKSRSDSKFSVKTVMSNKNIIKVSRFAIRELDIRDFRNHSRVMKVVNKNRSIRFSSNIVFSTNRVNIVHNRAEREPPISKKDKSRFFILKKIRDIRDAFNEKRRRESIRVLLSLKATKPKRDTVVYRYEEK